MFRCKMETLSAAFALARENNGAPGSDGVSFQAIEDRGRRCLARIQDKLIGRNYRSRRKEIAKEGGKVRVLSIPCIQDRVVQGALRLILEPISGRTSNQDNWPKRLIDNAML